MNHSALSTLVASALLGVSVSSAFLYFNSRSNQQGGAVADPAGAPIATSGVDPATIAVAAGGEADMETEILQLIDEMAAHPDDPQRPEGIVPVTDEQLAAMDPDAVNQVIEAGLEYAVAHPEEPRYLFQLGRAALAHGDAELGSELLLQAAEHGSAAAYAYLALLTEDEEEIVELLETAAAGGFEPAQAGLRELEEYVAQQDATQNAQFAATAPAPPPPQQAIDFSKFNRPDLIRAFHSGNVAALNDNLLENTIYAATLHQTWTDTQVLFLVEDRNIRLEIDPKMSYYASGKLMNSRQGMNQAVDAGLQSFLAPLMAIAGTRQSGGSVMDEVHAANKAMLNSPMVKLDVLKQQAIQDAERLALMYDFDPQTFRQVYAGLKQFLMN